MANVQILKLTTGEDVIGEVSEVAHENMRLITLSNPALIMMMPKDGNDMEFGIALAPYAPFAKDHQVPIMPAHIVSVFDPEPDLAKEYVRLFGVNEQGQKIYTPPSKVQQPATKQILKG